MLPNRPSLTDQERPTPAKGKARGRTDARASKRKLTKQRLSNITTYYLERHSSSEANLRRVMTRRIRRELTGEEGVDTAKLAEALGWLDEILVELKRQLLVDDRAYARGRAARDRRLAKPPVRTRAALLAKGVAREIVRDATEDDGSAEWTAAVAIARRRRLGPYRLKMRDADSDRHDLAVLARAGIGFTIAKRLLALADPPE